MTKQGGLFKLDNLPSEVHGLSFNTIAAVKYLADQVTEMQGELPESGFNPASGGTWPAAIIDPKRVLAGEFEVSQLPISYYEGFPTCSGVPIWERLESEPIVYFDLFRQYREMIGVRTLSNLAERTETQVPFIQQISQIYHWNLRAKAYDLYKTAVISIEKQRNLEVLQTEHKSVAREMRDIATNYLKENSHAMSPKNAIELFKLSIEAERLAVGLNPKKGDDDGKPTININNQLLQSNPTPAGGGKNGAGTDSVEQILSILERSGAFAAKTKRDVIDID